MVEKAGPGQATHRRSGRSRHKPTTGPKQIRIEIAIEEPAGHAEERLTKQKQEDTQKKTTTREVGSEG